ncbi:MAG: CoA transferase subunit A [Candidatus Riflebacteria bacterium]|nr:CoA transferase subunit A [Candidatus Riflebacteria bacterium]
MLVKPIISAANAAGKIKEGDSLMVGGFMACGSPHTIIFSLKEMGTKNLILICNDTADHDFKTGKITGVAHLVQTKQFKKIIASHIGANQETQRQMNARETEVELVPQGTLAEQIRAGGAGLGGFLTATGVGTEVANHKQIILVAHRPYLLELPLKADVAIIKAKKADKAGNLVFNGTARNFNPLMATAAALVIAEVEEIVETGEIDPNDVHTPSIFVDYLVKAEKIE